MSPDNQLDIAEAFFSGQYLNTLQKCIQTLNINSEDRFALEYLNKVSQIWAGGYHLDWATRHQFEQANTLIHLYRYSDARTIYQEIAETSGNDAWPYLFAHEALLRLDRLEQATNILHSAERKFHQDQWEESLIEYQDALRLAPELAANIQNNYLKREVFVHQNQQLQALIALPIILTQKQIDEIRHALLTTYTWQLEWPESVRVRSLVVAVETKLTQLQQTATAELAECLALAHETDQLQIAANLLRRAQALLNYIRYLPGNAVDIENFAEQIHGMEIEINAAQEIKNLLSDELLRNNNGQSLNISIPNHPAPELLSGLIKGLRQQQKQSQQIDILLPELDLCLFALQCDTPEQIATLALRFPHNHEVQPFYAIEDWPVICRLIRNISQQVAYFLYDEKPQHSKDIRANLEELTSWGNVQDSLLHRLANAIAIHWQSLLELDEATENIEIAAQPELVGEDKNVK